MEAPFKVTTMTGVVSFNLDKCQKEHFFNTYQKVRVDAQTQADIKTDFGLSIVGAYTRPKTMQLLDTSYTLQGVPVSIAYRPTAYTKKLVAVGNFFNQLSFKYQPDSKRCIKIFKNGSIHCSGFKSEREMQEDSVSLFRQIFLWTPEISSVQIVMANAMWHVHRRMCFKTMLAEGAKHDFYVVYDPELSSSRIKLIHAKSRYTLVVTVNGSVMYTYQNLDHTHEAYASLSTFLNSV